MADWIEFLASFDFIDRIEGFVSTFYNADWRTAYARAGVAGLVDEFFASLVASNCWKIYVQRHAGWNGAEIEDLLGRHGVRVWGRGFVGEQIYFCVKHRQARWAEYLLLRRGVPMTSALFDPRNSDYAERYMPGDEPPARR